MKEIKNVLICGLGGVGTLCAAQISKVKDINLKIVVDEIRYKKYTKEPTFFNDVQYDFDYVLPDNQDFKADLIIIATKSDGFDAAIKEIKSFTKNDTIFISLLNGISSEEKLAFLYGWDNTLISFYIGNSCIREDRRTTMQGNYKIVIGTKSKLPRALNYLAEFFTKTNINFEISDNILDEYWKKFMINVGINQLCAVTGLSLKQIKEDKELTDTLKGLMKEVKSIAKEQGVYHSNKIYKSAEKFLLNELEDAHPSMLQDIESGRKTEVDMFAGTVLSMGKECGIETPLNKKIYEEIKEIESNNKTTD
jgi:2-dehydropantoate 2-reductase